MTFSVTLEIVCLEPMCLRCSYFVGIWGVISSCPVWFDSYQDFPWIPLNLELHISQLSVAIAKYEAINLQEYSLFLLTAEMVLSQKRANPLLWASGQVKIGQIRCFMYQVGEPGDTGRKCLKEPTASLMPRKQKKKKNKQEEELGYPTPSKGASSVMGTLL